MEGITFMLGPTWSRTVHDRMPHTSPHPDPTPVCLMQHWEGDVQLTYNRHLSSSSMRWAERSKQGNHLYYSLSQSWLPTSRFHPQVILSLTSLELLFQKPQAYVPDWNFRQVIAFPKIKKKKNHTLLLNYCALTWSGKVLALKLRDHVTGASSATNKRCAFRKVRCNLSGLHL